MQSFGVVILAGGSGERFGEEKQFIELEGKELWRFPYELCIGIDECVECVLVFPRIGVNVGDGVVVVPGGMGRSRDCFAALEYIRSKRVVVLEAARPLVTREQILRLAGGLYPNIIYGYRETNTVYDTSVSAYIGKDNCFELCGTGGYDTEKLKQSYRDVIGKHKFIESCDSWVMRAGRYKIDPVVWDVGPVNNLFKVTYPGDLELLGVIKRQIENKK